MISPPMMATRSICKQIHLLFFDPVFHVAALAVDVVVKLLGIAFQRGDDKTGVASLARMFRFHDDTSFTVPGSSGIGECTEKALFFVRVFEGTPGLFRLFCSHGLETSVFWPSR